ncbi:MAG: TatD DNase family protein [Candidatus Woesearchaeota archaeon]|jgi:TatD DNase family protein
MSFIDVHAHMDHEQFDSDRNQVIKRAAQQEIVCIINNATDLPSMEAVLELAKEDICQAALGIYPEVAQTSTDDEIEEMFAFMEKHVTSMVCVGEIGLDYTYTKSDYDKNRQMEIFTRQLDFATKHDLPVTIHSRGAEKDVVETLIARSQKRVILHCFCGTLEIAALARDNRFFFSIPVRAVSSKPFQRLIEQTPLSLLLTETDSPYLHYKQERNEPGNVPLTVAKIAEIKKIEPQEAEYMIFHNYMRIFMK